MRVRPKLMTVATMLAGLVPLLWATGSGADVMKRIAAPMVGGPLTSAFLTLEIIPVVYTYWRQEQVLWERLAEPRPAAAAQPRGLGAARRSVGWFGARRRRRRAASTSDLPRLGASGSRRAPPRSAVAGRPVAYLRRASRGEAARVAAARGGRTAVAKSA